MSPIGKTWSFRPGMAVRCGLTSAPADEPEEVEEVEETADRTSCKDDSAGRGEGRVYDGNGTGSGSALDNVSGGCERGGALESTRRTRAGDPVHAGTTGSPVAIHADHPGSESARSLGSRSVEAEMQVDAASARKSSASRATVVNVHVSRGPWTESRRYCRTSRYFAIGEAPSTTSGRGCAARSRCAQTSSAANGNSGNSPKKRRPMRDARAGMDVCALCERPSSGECKVFSARVCGLSSTGVGRFSLATIGGALWVQDDQRVGKEETHEGDAELDAVRRRRETECG